MNKTIKVAYFLQRFPAITQTFIAREADWVRKHDVEITIFSLLPQTDKVVHSQSKRLMPFVVQSPYISLAIIRAHLFFLRTVPKRYAYSLGKLIRQNYREPLTLLKGLGLFPKVVYFAYLLKEGGFDHIHTHFIYIGAIAAAVASDLTGIEFSVRPHAFGLFQRDQKCVREALGSADKIITISTYHKEYIIDLCSTLKKEQLHVVYCGLETDLISPRPATSPSSTPQILSIGRAIEKKGHEYLIEACALLAQRDIDFHCQIVVGQDDAARRLQKLIDEFNCREYITLVGDKSQEEIVSLYNQCTVFALACVIARDGDRDGIPSVLIEAMACEVPVVTTRVAGIPDLVENEVNGLLVEERNASEMADGLERLIKDEQLRNRFGEQARKTVIEKFDILSVTKQLADIFRAS